MSLHPCSRSTVDGQAASGPQEDKESGRPRLYPYFHSGLALSGANGFCLSLCRTFTPVYCPSPLSGITPLLYVAQTRQSNILKILLQYGILERERKPFNIVLTILLYPSRVRIMVDHELVDIREDAKTCLVLCSRVLSVIPVREIEAQLSLGRRPIISNWLDYIPSTRYKDPCELSHLCRLAIRAQLLSNNMLPSGIFSLLIPARLQNYLNLES
ncbi:ankyrin repeat and SOCS box protein 17 [Vombatus ursinus]|nr:ankyrin repeat and SOCS box protein 17 [Vombatus ursinus]